MLWRRGKKPDGDAWLTTRGHLLKRGCWDEDAGLWYFEDDGRYHTEDEVIMWLPVDEMLKETKWLECLESSELTR